MSFIMGIHSQQLRISFGTPPITLPIFRLLVLSSTNTFSSPPCAARPCRFLPTFPQIFKPDCVDLIRLKGESEASDRCQINLEQSVLFVERGACFCDALPPRAICGSVRRRILSWLEASKMERQDFLLVIGRSKVFDWKPTGREHVFHWQGEHSTENPLVGSMDWLVFGVRRCVLRLQRFVVHHFARDWCLGLTLRELKTRSDSASGYALWGLMALWCEWSDCGVGLGADLRFLKWSGKIVLLALVTRVVGWNLSFSRDTLSESTEFGGSCYDSGDNDPNFVECRLISCIFE